MTRVNARETGDRVIGPGAGVDQPIGPAIDPATTASSYFNPSIEQLAPLIGQTVADVIAGLEALGATVIRNGDGFVTMDFVEGRVTYETDENGNVSQIAVEGGVIVDADSIKADPDGKVKEKPSPSPLPPMNPMQIVLGGLIGQSAADASKALNSVGIETIRIIGPNDAVTMDFVPGRGNIYVDDNGIVTRVQIEDVADTDNKLYPPAADVGTLDNPVIVPGGGLDQPIGPAIDPATTASSYFNPSIDQLAPFIGQPVADVIAGLKALGATAIRNGDGFVTMDFVEGRVTYETDENGNVSQIAVEGGVIVDADSIKSKPVKVDPGEMPKDKDPVTGNPVLKLLVGLIGQTGSDAAEALGNLGVTNIRIIGPNDMVTMDFVMGRANIYVDDKNVVTRIQIEGVADTDRGVLFPDAR
jgi:hypothetical protein